MGRNTNETSNLSFFLLTSFTHVNDDDDEEDDLSFTTTKNESRIPHFAIVVGPMFSCHAILFARMRSSTYSEEFLQSPPVSIVCLLPSHISLERRK